MKVEHGKIVEATEEELFSRYLRAGMDDIMSFYKYMAICEAHGTTITNKETDTRNFSLLHKYERKDNAT